MSASLYIAFSGGDDVTLTTASGDGTDGTVHCNECAYRKHCISYLKIWNLCLWNGLGSQQA